MATQLIVRTHNLDAFKERLIAVNKRLAKHHLLTPASIASVQAEFVSRNASPETVPLSLEDSMADARERILAAARQVEDLVYAVTLDVPTDLIQWQGHAVIGRIQRVDGAGDLVTAIGKHDVNLSVYRDKPFVCSHCGTRRPRKAIWVFQRQEDQAVLTLGDACAKEYFGVDVLSLLDDVWHVFGSAEDEEWGFGGSHVTGSRLGVLTAIFGASLIAFEGYRSRKCYEDDCTSYRASSLAYWVKAKGMATVSSDLGSDWHKFTRAWWAATEPRWQEFTRITTDARAWWDHQAPEDDYLANCRTAFMSMSPHQSGLLVCAVWEYMKAHGLVADARKDTYADAWLGSPKEKLQNHPVELVDVKAYDGGTFGPRYFVSFRDQEGHYLLWKTSSNPNESGAWKQGTHLLLSGTIKEHSQWKTLKQTILLRCRIAMDPTQTSGVAA